MKEYAICLMSCQEYLVIISVMNIYFLAHSRKMWVEVTGHRLYCQQLCGGMDIPHRLMFTCSSKEKINHLKELLENKKHK